MSVEMIDDCSISVLGSNVSISMSPDLQVGRGELRTKPFHTMYLEPPEEINFVMWNFARKASIQKARSNMSCVLPGYSR